MEFARSVWFGRVYGLVGFGLLSVSILVLHPGARWIFVAFVLAELIALVTAIRLVRGARQPDHGNVLLQNGERLPHDALWWHHRAMALETVVALGLAALSPLLAALQGRWETALVFAAIHLVLALALGTFAWTAWASGRLADGLMALADGDVTRSRRILEWWVRHGPRTQRHAFERCAARAALHAGDVDEAERRFESTWDGVLTQAAVPLARLRLGRGDPELAQGWLAARHPEGVVTQHGRAVVAAHLALWRGEPGEALDALASLPELPPSHARPVQLLRIAALQGLGRAEARAELALLPGGLERDAFMATAYPTLWQLLAQADGRAVASMPARRTVTSTPQPAPPAEVHTDPFAAPRALDRPPARARAPSGVVPVEWLSVEGSRREGRRGARIRGILLIGASSVLLLLGLVLTALTMLEDRPLERWIGLTASALGALVLGTAALQIVSVRGGSERGFVLGNGELVPEDRWSRWRWLRAMPSLIVVSLMLVGAVAGVGFVGIEVAVVSILVAGLVLWGASDPIRSGGVVQSAHLDPPEVAVERISKRLGWGYPSRTAARAWLGLALLWAGRGDEAEEVLVRSATAVAGPAQLLSWFSAARGEVDLVHLLARRPGEGLGPRYRHAVTLALAALATRREGRVRDRTGPWRRIADELPNRFGDLLRWLADVVEARIQGRDRPEPPSELSWTSEVWPCTAD
ncbi:MAG: hypothetical protein KTR31_27700 [Myxococcales bacterium]|nr:hypothetical protein [Myxococcales bacterium]